VIRFVLVGLLFSGVALAKPKTKAECEREVKDFMGICEKQACEKVGKKEPTKRASCTKMCHDQEPVLMKACERGKGK
jgi:hypothetical protein